MVQIILKSLFGMRQLMAFLKVVCLPNYLLIRFTLQLLRIPIEERAAGQENQKTVSSALWLTWDDPVHQSRNPPSI